MGFSFVTANRESMTSEMLLPSEYLQVVVLESILFSHFGQAELCSFSVCMHKPVHTCGSYTDTHSAEKKSELSVFVSTDWLSLAFIIVLALWMVLKFCIM